MPLYRCYFLDRHDRIRERTEIEADALSAAIDRAVALLQARPQDAAFEIWLGAERLYPESGEKRI